MPPKKPCSPEKIMNPKTGKCVNKSGKIGKKILSKSPPRSPSPLHDTQPPPRPVVKVPSTFTNVKKSYQTDVDDQGKPVMSVANHGAKSGQKIRIDRGGEYSGITVEVLEDMVPLLTENWIMKITAMIEKEEYATPLHLFRLKSIDELTYMLHTWYKVAIEHPSNNPFPSSQYKYPRLFDLFLDFVRGVGRVGLLGTLQLG